MQYANKKEAVQPDAQADQRLYYSSPRRNNICNCYVEKFMRLASSEAEQAGLSIILYEPRHDKTNKITVRPVKTQISLGICPD